MTDAFDMTMTTSTPSTDRDLLRTEYSVEERERMIAKMKEVRDSFYVAAVRVGLHQFIEFAGFMGEFIKICESMHKDGVDFGTNDLQPKDYQMAYIAEKFDCIFGEALMKPEMRKAFVDVLASKGGWQP